MESCVFGHKFRAGVEIGSGCFSVVYKGTDVETGKEVAIKLEPAASKPQLLLRESERCHVLAGGVGLPSLHWFGVVGQYNVMVIDLLGPSLGTLFKLCSSKFSLKTVLMLADQMISRVEYLHEKGFVHSDIKPNNFCVGLDNNAGVINIIDFGLTRSYIDPVSQQHIPYRRDKKASGNAQYASLNTHLGFEASRRDDLEAIWYLAMHFVRGNLPWQGLTWNSTAEKWIKVRESKLSSCPDMLCQDFPAEFSTYFRYCRNLQFEERPDYDYLRGLVRDVFDRNGYHPDLIFDWTIL